jgi:hypothetical protein
MGNRPKERMPELTLRKPIAPALSVRVPKVNSELGWSESDTARMGRTELSQAQSDAANVLAFIPYAKYLIPQERELFAQMEPDEQASALAWETFGAALFVGGGLITKFGGKGINKLQSYVRDKRLMKMVPVEDALENLSTQGGVWRGFNYANEAEGYMKSMPGKRFAQDEAIAIAKVIAGEDPVVLKAVAWEKGAKLSEKWQKSIGRIGEDTGEGVLRRELKLPTELSEALTPENMRARWARQLYTENLKIGRAGANLNYPERMMTEQVRRIYGPNLAKEFNIGQLSEPEMANILHSIFTPKGSRTIQTMHRLGVDAWLPYIKPARDVWGSGEELFNTKTKIFDKLINAMANANGYKIDKMNTLMAMLQQRGFGTIAKKATGWEFVPNKLTYNQETLKGATSIWQKIDNLAEQGRKGKLRGADGEVLSMAEVRQQIQEVVAQTKENAPIVHELVDLARTYTDYLYKDALQIGVPKMLDGLPLSAVARTKVEDLNKLWGIRAEQAFSSASGMDAPSKVALTRALLRDYKAIVKNPENFAMQLPEKELK